MPKFKVLMHYPDGTSSEEEPVFDTEEEAEEYGCVCCGECQTGAEILEMSNPGDYPDDGENADFEIIEIND